VSILSRCERAGAAVAIAAAIGVASGSCSSSTGPKPTSMVYNTGNNQTAAAGSVLPINPSVQILDQQFKPVQSYRVVFTVTAGGGSITGDTAYSDANGIAAVGSWTLGTTPGTNQLSAAAKNLSGSPLVFTATGN